MMIKDEPMRILLVIITLGVVTLTRAEDSTDSIRQQRIREHHARIEEIIHVNRVMQTVTQMTGAKNVFPPIVNPTFWDDRTGKSLREAGIGDHKLSELRELNAKLWELAKGSSTEPSEQTAARVSERLKKKNAVLSEGETARAQAIYLAALGRSGAPSDPSTSSAVLPTHAGGSTQP
jgi:hypothetical protein